jgi:hypothetical protein
MAGTRAIGAGDNGQHLDQRTAPEYTSLLRATRADPIIAAVGPSATIQGQFPSWTKEVRMVAAWPGRMPRADPIAAAASGQRPLGLCNLETSPAQQRKGIGHAREQ